jgi:hypothetical protein
MITEFPKGNRTMTDSTKIARLTLVKWVFFLPCMYSPLAAFYKGEDYIKYFWNTFGTISLGK